MGRRRAAETAAQTGSGCVCAGWRLSESCMRPGACHAAGTGTGDAAERMAHSHSGRASARGHAGDVLMWGQQQQRRPAPGVATCAWCVLTWQHHSSHAWPARACSVPALALASRPHQSSTRGCQASLLLVHRHPSAALRAPAGRCRCSVAGCNAWGVGRRGGAGATLHSCSWPLQAAGVVPASPSCRPITGRRVFKLLFELPAVLLHPHRLPGSRTLQNAPPRHPPCPTTQPCATELAATVLTRSHRRC